MKITFFNQLEPVLHALLLPHLSISHLFPNDHFPDFPKFRLCSYTFLPLKHFILFTDFTYSIYTVYTEIYSTYNQLPISSKYPGSFLIAYSNTLLAVLDKNLEKHLSAKIKKKIPCSKHFQLTCMTFVQTGLISTNHKGQ